MKKLIVCLLIIFLYWSLPALSQESGTFECGEIEDPYSYIPAQRGGRYFTEEGVVKAMVVFIQFVGDSTNPYNQNWPLNQPPIYAKKVLDSTLTPQTADEGSLSHWFREMSFNKLKIYGDAYFVITDSTKQWYIDNNKNYGDVNKDVLKKLDDQVDYSQYDNWTFGYSSPYNHENEPDSIVDMIIMIYREWCRYDLGLPGGIANLGFYGNLSVDNDSTYIRGHFPGSGQSDEHGYWGRESHRYAHELGHNLLGSGHPGYNKEPQGYAPYGFWGLLFANSHLINAYDRHWLRWVDYTDLDISDSLDIAVSDYLTTGDAYRIALPGTNDEAFFIENHQELSYFDDWIYLDGSTDGLYIYHVKGTNQMPKFDMEIAEGRFNWSNPFWILNPWGGPNNTDSIPVYTQLSANRTGYDGTDAIPHTKNGTYKIYVTDNDQNGFYEVNRRVLGSPLDAFSIGYNEIFSPWSSPNSNAWNDTDTTDITIEILSTYTGINGEDIYNLRIRMLDGENGPPSKVIGLTLTATEGEYPHPLLSWYNSMEPDLSGYNIYRKIDDGNWEYIDNVEDSTYIDYDIVMVIGEGEDVFYVSYKVKAKDNQNKLSLPSDIVTTVSIWSDELKSIEYSFDFDNVNLVPYRLELFQNYPNPFNPSTIIRFGVPEDQNVSVKIYSITGEEIITLMDGYVEKGFQELIWNGKNKLGTYVASGMYFCVLKSADQILVRKMMLLR